MSRTICYTLILICAFVSCKPKERVSAFNYHSTTPVVDWDKSIKVLEFDFDIYMYGDFRIYRLPYVSTVLRPDSMPVTENKSYYFIFHRDSVYGRAFANDTLFAFYNQRLRVDSMLTKNTFSSQKLESLLAIEPDSLMKRPNGDLIKVYTLPIVKGEPGKFRVYLSYGPKLNNVERSLSKIMDNERGYTLYQVVTKASEAYYPEQKFTMPAREYAQQLKQISKVDSSIFMDFIKKYKSI